MIISNGTIRFKQKTPQGIDPVTGYPVKPTSESWGDGVECQYLADRYDQLARAMGQSHTSQSYTILVEGAVRIESEQVRLEDSQGGLIGEFSVIRVDRLDAVYQIRIIV